MVEMVLFQRTEGLRFHCEGLQDATEGTCSGTGTRRSCCTERNEQRIHSVMATPWLSSFRGGFLPGVTLFSHLGI